MKHQKRPYSQQARRKSSWQGVSDWYQKSVGEKGHFFHRTVVLPGVLKLLRIQAHMRLLDLGCGQGVLERALPQAVSYVGVDSARSLIAYATDHRVDPSHEFLVADATQKLLLPEKSFDRAAIILALQNMKDWHGVVSNLERALKVGGRVVVVLNHPYFRIPKQTAWGEEEQSKRHYRKVYGYMEDKEIPITMNPGKSANKLTWSYHRPLATLITLMTDKRLLLAGMEEWVSGKTSEGIKARMENRARREIPLFMALVFEKI